MKFDTLDFISKLVAFESVSADSSRAGEVRKCAEFLANALNSFGFSAKIVETDLHPIIVAERKSRAQPPKIKIMCYGHYDVQPEDPVEKWSTPPFETVVRDGKIWGRGTADNKGPFSCMLAGLLEFFDKHPDAPADFTLVFEGEEEIGSPSITKFISDNADFISQNDILLLSDTSAAAVDQPVVTVGLRGTASFEAIFKGPNTDIHSGMFGGMVYNPLQAMAEVCASLHGADGLVNIDKFYDGLETLSDWERAEIAKSPFGEDEVRAQLGVKKLYVQNGFRPSEAVRVLPTVEFTGMGGGYQGEGSKSVIPSECFCKISCRTVPLQNTRAVVELVKEAIRSRTPEGVGVSFIESDSFGDPYFVNPKAVPADVRGKKTAAVFAAADECAEKCFGRRPIYLREGASIPLISTIKRKTGVDSVLFGLFTPADNLHAPNEGFSLKMVENASKYYEMFFEKIIK